MPRDVRVRSFAPGRSELSALSLRESLSVPSIREQARSEAAKGEREAEPLTDAMMKKMMPLFVESTKPDDHKCGSCSMRVEKEGDKGECTVVDVPISLSKGVCLYWAKGDGASEEDVHESRMSREIAAYEEVDGKVQCGTCVHFQDGRYCSLWMGKVKDGQCCISWEAA